MGVDTTHADYARALSRWTRCRDVYEGEDAVKAKKSVYLPVLEGQSGDGDADYGRYLERALFFPAYERTVAGLLGSVMRRDPEVRVPAVVESHVDDLTLAHEPFTAFANEALEEVLAVGRYLGVIDWRGADGSREGARGRPWWMGYTAESVINWREAWVGGWWQPVLVVVRETEEVVVDDEFAPQTAALLRVFQLRTGPGGTLATTTLWRQRPDQTWEEGPTDFLLRNGRPLPFLPLCFLGPRGVRVRPAKPPLLDLASVSLSLYRTLADLEHGRHFTALPTPWITGWTSAASGGQGGGRLAIGSGTAWEFPDKDTSVGMLEFKGEGLGALERAADEKRKMLAVLGARLLEEQPRGAETAEAVRLRHAGEHATLSTITGSVSLGLTRLLRFHAYWLGDDGALQTPDVGAELNRQFFDARITAQELQALVATWQAGGISGETLYWNMRQGNVARPGVEWEEERKLIEAEDVAADEEGAGGEPEDDDAAGAEDDAAAGGGGAQAGGAAGAARAGASR